jgi:hypothetical protein
VIPFIENLFYLILVENLVSSTGTSFIVCTVSFSNILVIRHYV